MPCMEVWGGNQAVDGGVVMSGLDAWIYSRPYRGDASGGDVYYVSSCATGRVTRLLVADVSGHGAEAAETGAGLRLLMRRYVNHIDQHRFMLALNEQFQPLAEGGRFATAIVATFFAPTNRLTLSNAGHPPPLLWRSRRRTWDFVASDHDDGDAAGGGLADVPLGVVERSEYAQLSVRLRVGDLLLFYTDSLVEGRMADGRRLGQDGLLGVARGLQVDDPADLLPALRGALAEQAPESLTADDLTLLLVRPNGMAPRVPWSRRLAAPFRVAGGVFGALFRGDRPIPWPQWSVVNILGAMIQSLNRRV